MDKIFSLSKEQFSLWVVTAEIMKRKGSKRKLPGPPCEKQIGITEENAEFVEKIALSFDAENEAVLNIILDLIRQEMLSRKWIIKK